MKMRWLILLVVITAGGCICCRPKDEHRNYSKKELEIYLLQTEVDVAVKNLYALQRRLTVRDGAVGAIPGALPYSAENKDSDLDRMIQILREARGQLAAEEQRLREQYRVPKPEY